MSANLQVSETLPVAPIPTAKGHWLLGSLLEFRRDSLGGLKNAAANYGDIVRLRFLHIEYLFFNHPDAIKHVLQDNHRNYVKTPSYHKMKIFIGEGLLTSEGDFWRRQRRMAQPGFHREQLAGLAARMSEEAQATVARWQAAADKGPGRGPGPGPVPGEPQAIDLTAEMSRLTMRIASTTLFGMGLDEEDARAIGRAVEVAQEETERRVQELFNWPLWLPTPRNRRANQAIAALDGIVYRMIERRRRDPKGTHELPARIDLLQMLLDARDADTGEGMSDRELRDEVATIFTAGHETTANALGWTFHLLAEHPAVEDELRAELSRVLGGRAPGLEDLKKLPYMHQVIEESLRLYPPAWGLERRAVGPDVVMGHPIGAGTNIVLCPWTTHRHPAFWRDPERFDPTRFSTENSAGRRRYAYYPFGGGPRLCIGREFALMELQLVLPVLLQAFRFAPVPGQRVELLPQITLRSRYPLRYTLTQGPAVDTESAAMR